MTYTVQRVLPYPVDNVWSVLKDVRHYADNDPFHHDLVFLGEQREGVGTTFLLRHTYLPLFPFLSDTVVCSILQWEPRKRQILLEKNERAYRTHTQDFTLERRGDTTMVTYSIGYRGIPQFLLPWKWWVGTLVEKRMRQKLGDLERACEEKSI